MVKNEEKRHKKRDKDSESGKCVAQWFIGMGMVVIIMIVWAYLSTR